MWLKCVFEANSIDENYGAMLTTDSLKEKRRKNATRHISEWATLDRVHVTPTYYIFHFYFHLSFSVWHWCQGSTENVCDLRTTNTFAWISFIHHRVYEWESARQRNFRWFRHSPKSVPTTYTWRAFDALALLIRYCFRYLLNLIPEQCGAEQLVCIVAMCRQTVTPPVFYCSLRTKIPNNWLKL